jgi:glycosyltransferase involved in cell wall biosynthesis
MQLFYTFDIEAGGGGLSRFAIELGKKLDARRFEVILVSLGYFDTPLGQNRIRQLNDEGFHSFEAAVWDDHHPYASFYRAYRNLYKILSHQSIDIIHSHSEYTDITALMLKISGVAPIILRTVHYGYHEEWARKPLRRAILTNFLYPLLFNAEIGINQANTDRLNHRWVARLLNREALKIYNAIPLERFENLQVDREAKKNSLGIPRDAIIIGSVGRLTEQKGYCYLIEAAPAVLQEYPNAYFLIVGDGHLKQELIEQANARGISSHVIFTGARTDVEELLQCMDLFVSSSLWEGLPTVILEAMACRVPVVATNIPGTNELVLDRINGWLAPAKDSRALGEIIVHALRDSQHWSKITAEAEQTIRNFAIDSIAKEYEDLYLLMMKRNRGVDRFDHLLRTNW